MLIRQNKLFSSLYVLGTGLAIAMIIFGLNLFGDGLRDALDPRLKT